MDFNGNIPNTPNGFFTGDQKIDGTLTTTGSIFLPDGKDSAPALSFTSEPTLGLEKSASGEVAFVSSGSKRLKVSSTAVTPTVPIAVPQGTQSSPSVGWPLYAGNHVTGIYQPSQDTLALTSSGVDTITTNGNITHILPYVDAPQALFTNATVTTLHAPTIVSTTTASLNQLSASTAYLDSAQMTNATATTLVCTSATTDTLVATVATTSTLVATAATTTYLFCTGATVSTLTTTSQPFMRWSSALTAYPKNSTTTVSWNSLDLDPTGLSSILTYNTSTSAFTTTVDGFYSFDLLQQSNYTSTSDGTRNIFLFSATPYLFSNVAEVPTSAITSATTNLPMHFKGFLAAGNSFYFYTAPRGSAGNVNIYHQIMITKEG